MKYLLTMLMIIQFSSKADAFDMLSGQLIQIRIPKSSYKCGGVFIKDRLILTAGHCAKEFLNTERLHVKQFQTSVKESLEGVIRVEKIHFAPNYFEYVKLGHAAVPDVALIEVIETLNWELATLSYDQFFNGMELTVTAAGRCHHQLSEGYGPNNLFHETIVIDSSKEYSTLVRGSHLNNLSPFEAPCHGDSGSPTFRQGKVVGLNSHIYRDPQKTEVHLLKSDFAISSFYPIRRWLKNKLNDINSSNELPQISEVILLDGKKLQFFSINEINCYSLNDQATELEIPEHLLENVKKGISNKYLLKIESASVNEHALKFNGIYTSELQTQYQTEGQLLSCNSLKIAP